ncbi:LUD domain-containing protein [Desulfobacterales bacterium HSG17]|nr:LUD domain-containing protein [Desulfobacterales bacterium HSG17]
MINKSDSISDNNARERIFSRLESAVKQGAFNIPEPEELTKLNLDQKQKIDLLKKNMEAVRSEVHVVNQDTWIENLKQILKDKNINSLVYAPETEMGKLLENSLKEDSPELFKYDLIKYNRNMEDFKSRIFETDAGITSTRGGIADTGALILWPDEKEPRLLSLIPQSILQF